MDDRIKRDYKNERYADRFGDLLKLQELILVILYINAKYCDDEHLFITDNSEITEPNSM